jgi:peptidoglycan/LPS O-acetylase OafA/YrhL
VESHKKLPYIPQLDSFRFIAVLLVIIAHWVPFNIINHLPNGFMGVTFFYVLSGFLISTILLYNKKSICEAQLTISKALKTFYFRRTLRIFPLYYLALVLVYIGNKELFLGNTEWYFLYVPNILVYKTKLWPGMLSHFWSLGVEEQFYLIWPMLIFWVSWERLKYLFSGIVILSVVSKIIFFVVSGNGFFNYYDTIPINCFDAFGIGALLSLITVEKGTYQILEKGKFQLFLAGSVIASVLIFLAKLPFVFGITVSLASSLIILKACEGYKGLVGKILNLPIFLFLGRISYGLYVYHNFMPWLLRCIRGTETAYPLNIPHFSMPWLEPKMAVGIQFVMLLIVATMSWYIFERPLNNLKKYFKA